MCKKARIMSQNSCPGSMAHIQLWMPFHYIQSTPYTCLTHLTFTAVFMSPYLNLSSLTTKDYSPHEYMHIQALSSQRKGRSGLLTRLSMRKHSRGYQYLMQWVKEGPETDSWLPRSEVEECEALDVWLKANNHL